MIDYGALILVAVLTVAFCLPFIYFHYKKINHEKKLIRDFMSKAQELQLQISAYDLWRRTYVLGMDRFQLKLLYMKFGQEEKVMLLDLSHFRKVRIVDEHIEVGTGREKEKTIIKLGLAFHDVNPHAPGTSLEFYNADETQGLMGEPLLIEKWRNQIQNLLDESRPVLPKDAKNTRTAPKMP